MLNTLDATSTGLLVFPPSSASPAFGTLQAPAMSIYVMSTIISQLVLTLGGSGFPGALGGMLVEVLPFLRALASDIMGELGRDSPKLVPTVVAAYALTSFLIGACFLGLGMLRLGWTVDYIPTTVLHGTIGALGLSLFILGFELTVPSSAPELTLKSANDVLFSKDHFGLVLAVVLPTLVLCVTLRWSFCARVTRGWTEHAMYVPFFMLLIGGVFWIVVAGLGLAMPVGMAQLANQGWLFALTGPLKDESGLGTSWNYFKLFNFNLVQWSAMKAGIGNMVLLVVIGVLNLPIYIPAMSLILKQPNISMDWELIGHGVSNILSGCAGSLPNLIVLSSSRLFTFAGGGRVEGFITAVVTLVTFFCAGRLLPYVPTIVAAVLVCFLGLDLVIESLVIPAKELLWSEWAIAFGTAMACTWIGFLEGFGIGVAAAIIQYCLWNFYDMVCAETGVYHLDEDWQR
ncbi:hypothetical protein KEM52_002013 [Ascosphaera acerosa]|nr:hypothetical protein KEM52_002013 [Ascosphaera acerosa]